MPRKKPQQSTVTLFYPNGVTIGDLQHEVANDYNGTVADINFFLFFHLLSEPYLDYNNDSPNEFIQVHRAIKQAIFRDEYPRVIASLVAADYIQENPSYSNLYGYCKSYRIHPKRMDITRPLSFVKEKADGYFMRKLRTLQALNLSQERTDSSRQHVINQTANLILVPDTDALQYITEQYAQAGNPNPAQHYFDYFNNSPLKEAAIDKFGFRLHSVITNMPKVLRRCLRFISCPSVPVRELDIVNSQPFFLSSVTAALIAQFVPDAMQAVPVFQRYESEPDFIKFKTLCQSGRIYEFLINEFELNYYTLCEGDAETKRDFAKKLTYGVLFGDYDQKDANAQRECKTVLATVKRDFYAVYKDAFPSVYATFKAVKGFGWDCTVNGKGERKNYANNCLLAQRLESGVMYGHIVAACINNGFTELVTVHDCLLVREDEAESIKSIAEHTFQLLGLNPKFK